jgi:hypothetical protein
MYSSLMENIFGRKVSLTNDRMTGSLMVFWVSSDIVSKHSPRDRYRRAAMSFSTNGAAGLPKLFTTPCGVAHPSRSNRWTLLKHSHGYAKAEQPHIVLLRTGRPRAVVVEQLPPQRILERHGFVFRRLPWKMLRDAAKRAPNELLDASAHVGLLMVVIELGWRHGALGKVGHDLIRNRLGQLLQPGIRTLARSTFDPALLAKAQEKPLSSRQLALVLALARRGALGWWRWWRRRWRWRRRRRWRRCRHG